MENYSWSLQDISPPFCNIIYTVVKGHFNGHIVVTTYVPVKCFSCKGGYKIHFAK